MSFLALTLIAGLLAAPASAQVGGVAAQAGGGTGVPIMQMILNDNGTFLAQNGPAAGVTDSDDDPVEVVSITVNDNGHITILDDFNIAGATVDPINVPAGATGYSVYENGLETPRSDGGYQAAVERNLSSPDLRDHLRTDAPSLANTWGADFDAIFAAPFYNDDYIVVAERDGNSAFSLTALDENGSAIAGGVLAVPGSYAWNTGYAPSYRMDQPMHISVFDIEDFGLDTDATPIHGFRFDNPNEADIKLLGVAGEPFTVICPPGAPIDDVPAAQTGAWTQVAPNTWTAPFGDTTVTMVESGSVTAQTSLMDALDTNDYSVAGVAGASAVEVIHWFPQSKTMTFSFADPVEDPTLHIARLGGYSGWGDLTWSHSTRFTLGGGLTWQETASNGPHFSSTGTTAIRTTGTLLDPALRTFQHGTWNWGTAGGSLEIAGTVSTIPLTLDAVGQQFNEGTGDGVEFVITKPAVEGCGGITDFDVSKSANSNAVIIGGEVEWSLAADSISTAQAEGLILTDNIPDGLDAKTVRTGRWLPADLEAEFAVRVDGAWTTIATARGDADASYSLPFGVDQLRVSHVGNTPTTYETTSPIVIVTDVSGAEVGGNVQNCASWSASEMSKKVECAQVEVQADAAGPNLTVWNETGSAAPREDLSFKVRVENLNTAARDYVEPFVGTLLPANLDYTGWEPITAATAPAVTVVEDHNGTGRTLVRFDFDGVDFAPGELFDLRVITTVVSGSAPGSATLEVGTSTNDDSIEVECSGSVAADVFDIDTDGTLAEQLCTATADFDVAAHFEIGATAYSTGDPGLPFIEWDETTGSETVSLDDIATGINSHIEDLPNIDTGIDTDESDLAHEDDDPFWTTSIHRTSTRDAAVAVPGCDADHWEPAPAVQIWEKDKCNGSGDRWFQREFTLNAFNRPEELLLLADSWVSGDFTVYVNGVRQTKTAEGYSTPTFGLTGPFQAGVNLIEIEVDVDDDKAFAIDFEWARVVENDAAGAQDIDLSESATHTQSSTGTWGWPASADLAGDGNTDGDYWNGSVSHTSGTRNNWWQADLHVVAPIDTVTVYNRTDCCSDRTVGAVVFLSQEPFTSNTIEGMRAQAGVVEFALDDDALQTGGSGGATVFANNALARYVRVALDGEYLHLAEVDINGHYFQIEDSVEVDDDWTVSDTLNSDRRPAVVVSEGCYGAWADAPGNAERIWFESCTDTGDGYFHRTFELEAADDPASLVANMSFLVDNTVEDVYVNGVRQDVTEGGWSEMNTAVLEGPFVVGVNTISIHARNVADTGGLEASFGWERPGVGCPDVDGFTTRPCIAQTTSHSTGAMRFDIENLGNISAGGAVVYGSLPFHGDTFLISGEARDSDFTAYLTEEVIIGEQPADAAVTVEYSTSRNPCRPELGGQAPGVAWPAGCDMDWAAAPADLSTVTAIRVVADLGAGDEWTGGERLEIRANIRAAQGSPERDEVSFMSFGYMLEDQVGNPTTPVEPQAAGLLIPQGVNGIGDRIWLDADRNGVQDPGEVGVNGVQIELYDADRNLVATTESQNLNNDTAQPGYYWFGDLEPGQYFIKLVKVPLSWNTMTPDVGFDDVDSDISPLTHETTLITVELIGQDRSYDVGFFIPQGPAACIDDRPEFDPTDTDLERRGVAEASPCPS